MLARGCGFGYPRQEECLCLTIHTPNLYIAHCFQLHRMHALDCDPQPLSVEQKVTPCAQDTEQKHGKQLFFELFFLSFLSFSEFFLIFFFFDFFEFLSFLSFFCIFLSFLFF